MKTFFISSTFKDMQAERDILHERVFPRLRALIKALGDDVQEVDLRWGVDTVNMSEEESGHEVLRICIDAIDRCRPYMIVLLGQRYGWIPEKAIVDSARDQRISDHYEQEMSITELEIRYGALLQDEVFENCIFCFRDPDVLEQIDPSHRHHYSPESSRHSLRLAALKNQIRAKENAVILEYSAQWDHQKQTLCDLEDFAERVYSLLESIIRKDFSEFRAVSPMEQQVREVRLIRDSYLSTYTRRYPEEFGIARHIADFQRDIRIRSGVRQVDCLLLTGGAGTGKSALMAYMAECIPELRDKTILCFGAASGCKDLPSLKRYIAYCLEELLSLPHADDIASIDQHLRTLDKAAGSGYVCFVDALDQIYHGQPDPYLDLPALCPHIFWVFSALPEFPFAQAAADYRWHSVPVGSLLPSQRREMISRTAGKRGKDLDRELIETITATAGSGNPLFLSLLLQRLFMMNKEEFEAAEHIAPGMEGLHRYMARLLAEIPDMPERLVSYILEVTAQRFDQGQFSEILMLIACSHNGLTERELEQLLALEDIPFFPVRFQQIVSYLYDAFDQRSNGKWTFHHRLFHEAILGFMAAGDRERIYGLLVKYALTDADFLRQEGFRYLLERKHSGFARVLEASSGWDTREAVAELVGTCAGKHSDIREFLIRLAENHATDPMAAFWLDFPDYLYGPDVEAMAGEIIRILLEAPSTHERKWELVLRRTYDLPAEARLALYPLAETWTHELPEPERSAAVATIQATLAQDLSAQRKPYEQIHAAQAAGIAAADRALAHFNESTPWKRHSTLFESIQNLLNISVSWKDPDAERLWLHYLSILEAAQPVTGEQQDEHTSFRVLYLCQICDMYRRKPWRNYEKAKLYIDRAMTLAEAAASQRPTIRNLRNKYYAIRDYVAILKEEYTYPHRKQMVDCVRQLYALQKTDSGKRDLAVALFEYGLSYFSATKANTLRPQTELEQDAISCMDQGSSLFEELHRDNYRRQQLRVYASLLVERAERKCDMPDVGLQHGLRSLELIRQHRDEVQHRLDTAPDPYTRQREQSDLDWCIGWSARANTAVAELYHEMLDHASSLRFAQAGLELSLIRAKTASAYRYEVLTCALLIAQNNYCLRHDEDALHACGEIAAILDAFGIQGENREPTEAELLYIRSRLALERGETDLAWQYCMECMAKRKTQLLFNKVLILKADCLEALGDPASDNAWRDALAVWRKLSRANWKTFYSYARGLLSMNAVPPEIRLPWRTAGTFTLPACYMAYCYHHYVTDQDRYSREYEVFEQKVLAAVRYQGKGWLKGRMPYRMTEVPAVVLTDSPVPDCTDFDSFISVLENMTDFQKSHTDPNICKAILTHIERFADVIPGREQYNTLQSIARILYDQLYKENDLYSEKQECDLLQALFCPETPFPVCRVGFLNQLEVWPQGYAEDSGHRWHALLKLLLLLMRRNSVVNRNNFTKIGLAYQIVSGRIGGSEELEKADLGFLSDQDLIQLLSIYDRERELRIKFSNIYWYAKKNVWTAELYRRTGDTGHITRRLLELEEFLTEPCVQLYRQLDFSRKTDMPTEVAHAARHLIHALNERNGEAQTITVLRWAESKPELAGNMSSRILHSIQTDNGTDLLWLEEVRLRYCQQWLAQSNGRLDSLCIY